MRPTARKSGSSPRAAAMDVRDLDDAVFARAEILAGRTAHRYRDRIEIA
jgi:hypothetical protein